MSRATCGDTPDFAALIRLRLYTSLPAVHPRPIRERRTQFNDRCARITDRRGLMAAEVVRGGFQVADRLLQLANRGDEAWMLGRLAPHGLRGGHGANGSAQHCRRSKRNRYS